MLSSTFLAVSEELVSAVHSKTALTTVALFVGVPPLPLAYRCELSQGSRLRDFLKQRYREPAVERALRYGQPQWENPRRRTKESALVDDVWALAYPLNHDCCLYLGDGRSNAASVAIDKLSEVVAPYRMRLMKALRTTRQSATHRNTQATLRTSSNLLDTLQRFVESVEVVNRSLDIERILESLQEVTLEHSPHKAGTLHALDRTLSWGEHPPTLPAGTTLSGKPITWDQGRFVGVALTDHGDLILDAGKGALFRSETLRYLELLAHHATLALQNAQLHRQLEESRGELLQASKMQAVGQLGAGVAHELNSPLGAFSLQLELMKVYLDKDPGKILSVLEKAETTVESMAAIISRLLAYSRRSDGVRTGISLNEVAQQTVLLLNHCFAELGANLILQPSAPITLQGSSQDLAQALTSLLTNSAEALARSADDKPRKCIVSLVETGDYAQFEVYDSGAGMAPEVLGRCLEPFFTTKAVGQGPGLGLWVAEKIARQHGGSLSIESVEKEFTKVILRVHKAGGESVE